MIRPLREVRREAEISAIIEAIMLKGCKLRAAIALGIHRNTLERWIIKYGIDERIRQAKEQRRRQRKLRLEQFK